MRRAAASPFSGSVGLGYRRSCGRKLSKMLIMSNMGDHVWFITSRQTDPELIVLVSPDISLDISILEMVRGNPQLVDIGVEDAINKPNTR